ncbi:MAG: rhsA [Frondihabitans sp.]|nr:rhsA [Frondihabitans sp.]
MSRRCSYTRSLTDPGLENLGTSLGLSPAPWTPAAPGNTGSSGGSSGGSSSGGWASYSGVISGQHSKFGYGGFDGTDPYSSKKAYALGVAEKKAVPQTDGDFFIAGGVSIAVLGGALVCALAVEACAQLLEGGDNEDEAASSSGGAAAVRAGQAGEAAVKDAYKIGDKATRVIDGRTRIFDGLNDDAVSEVKNVKYQAFTQQLKDSLAYAQEHNVNFDLYVRGDQIQLRFLDRCSTPFTTLRTSI